MAEYLGRSLLLKKNDILIATIRSKSISCNGEPVDITTDDDGGHRKLLDELGQKSTDISFDGIEEDGILRGLWFAGGMTQKYTDFTLTWPDGSILASDFVFATYEESGTYNDAVGFSATLQSSGAPTYTPPV